MHMTVKTVELKRKTQEDKAVFMFGYVYMFQKA